jgi:hypothetical protein
VLPSDRRRGKKSASMKIRGTGVPGMIAGPSVMAGPDSANAQQKVSIPTLTPPGLPTFLRHESPVHGFLKQ